MITARQFRDIRRRAMRELAPDFVEDKDCYIRITTENQLHCMEFGHPRRAPGWCLDLGLHFAGVPHFGGVPPCAYDYHPGKMREYKCWLERRWRDPSGNQFQEYGETSEIAVAFVRRVIRDCLDDLNGINQRWQAGANLIDEISPDVLANDFELLQQIRVAPIEQHQTLHARKSISRIFQGWYSSIERTGLMLAYLSLRRGRSELIPHYVEISLSDHWKTTYQKELAEEILKQAANEPSE